MKGLYQFIIKPLDGRYDNIKKISDKELIINTGIEDHRFVSKRAIILATPSAFESELKTGDEVIVHHNIFRRYYDMKGRERNSGCFFKEDMYLCSPDQIYLYKKDDEYKTHLNYCFIKPILNKSDLSLDIEEPLMGIVKYSNNSLEAKGITPGALVTFKPDSEFEFHVGEERLYCMKSNNIVIEHEYQGDEEEHNPSWANSC